MRYFLIRKDGEAAAITFHKRLRLDRYHFGPGMRTAEEITKVEFETYQEFEMRKVRIWRVKQTYIVVIPSLIPGRMETMIAKLRHKIDWDKWRHIWF